MRLEIKRWGNSAALRLPARVLEQVGLGVDSSVDVKVEEGRIILAPAEREPDLSALVKAITPENRHDEITFGASVGREW